MFALRLSKFLLVKIKTTTSSTSCVQMLTSMRFCLTSKVKSLTSMPKVCTSMPKCHTSKKNFLHTYILCIDSYSLHCPVWQIPFISMALMLILNI